jgi:hypothetical protein
VIADAFLDTAAVASALLRGPELAAGWGSPSALADFRISGLAGHLARAVFNVERYLDTPIPAELIEVDAVRYYLLQVDEGPDDPVRQSIRERGEQDAGSGPTELADRYDDARRRLATRLRGLPSDHPVAALAAYGRFRLRLDQCLITRLVELTVHLDDLAISLGLPTPTIPQPAADLVVTTLARVAAGRHGTVALIRALSRRERAPGVIAAF